MLALYHFAQSTCSIKVRLLLAEKELMWQDNMLVSSEHNHLTDWYLKLNPNGVVPTLLDDNLPVFESTSILEYLEDKYTETSFRPFDHYMRSQMRAFLVFVDVWPHTCSAGTLISIWRFVKKIFCHVRPRIF